MEILFFITAVFASLLDPISFSGYLVAGILIKNRIVSVISGAAWRLVLYLTIVAPSMKMTQSTASSMYLFAALAGAGLATFVINLVASSVRKRKSIDAFGSKGGE